MNLIASEFLNIVAEDWIEALHRHLTASRVVAHHSLRQGLEPRDGQNRSITLQVLERKQGLKNVLGQRFPNFSERYTDPEALQKLGVSVSFEKLVSDATCHRIIAFIEGVFAELNHTLDEYNPEAEGGLTSDELSKIVETEWCKIDEYLAGERQILNENQEMQSERQGSKTLIDIDLSGITGAKR